MSSLAPTLDKLLLLLAAGFASYYVLPQIIWPRRDEKNGGGGGGGGGRRGGGDDDDDDDEDQFMMLVSKAEKAKEAGEYEQAEKYYQFAVRLIEDELGAHADEHASSAGLAPLLEAVAMCQTMQYKYVEARASWQRCLTIMQRNPRRFQSHRLADVQAQLGDALMKTRRFDDAERETLAALELFATALGDDADGNPSVPLTLDTLASIRMKQLRYDEAEKDCRRAIELLSAHTAAPQHKRALHQNFLQLKLKLGQILWLRGQRDECERTFLECLDDIATQDPQASASVLATRFAMYANLVAVYAYEAGHVAFAVEQCKRAVAKFDELDAAATAKSAGATPLSRPAKNVWLGALNDIAVWSAEQHRVDEAQRYTSLLLDRLLASGDSPPLTNAKHFKVQACQIIHRDGRPRFAEKKASKKSARDGGDKQQKGEEKEAETEKKETEKKETEKKEAKTEEAETETEKKEAETEKKEAETEKAETEKAETKKEEETKKAGANDGDGEAKQSSEEKKKSETETATKSAPWTPARYEIELVLKEAEASLPDGAVIEVTFPCDDKPSVVTATIPAAESIEGERVVKLQSAANLRVRRRMYTILVQAYADAEKRVPLSCCVPQLIYSPQPADESETRSQMTQYLRSLSADFAAMPEEELQRIAAQFGGAGAGGAGGAGMGMGIGGGDDDDDDYDDDDDDDDYEDDDEEALGDLDDLDDDVAGNALGGGGGGGGGSAATATIVDYDDDDGDEYSQAQSAAPVVEDIDGDSDE